MLSITANKPTWLNVVGTALVGIPDQAMTFAGIELTATNAYGTDTETFTITVGAAAGVGPTITSTGPAGGQGFSKVLDG